VVRLLEGKNVNLRVVERDDTDFMVDCFNNIDFWGEYDPIAEQKSKTERMKQFDNPSNWAILTERKRFIIQKRDATRIGFISHWTAQPSRMVEIGYHILPSERGKGYGTEAVQLMIDYLFLSQNIFRIQAITNVRNNASQKVLEKAGFKIEGTIRKSAFVRGVMTNAYLYSILREEWKEPRILKKTT
jgi:RimJ/RimL family protein N-acetyltransferase